MEYGYARRPSTAWTVTGTGAAFQTDVRLSNGQPGEGSVISWLSEVSPTVADYIDLRGDWSAGLVPGAVSIQGLSCGAGVKIEVTGKRAADSGYPYDLGGSSLTQRTFANSDGRVEFLLVLAAGLDPIIGIQIRIFNDRSSVTWATDATDLTIGEVDVWATVELCGKPGWVDSSNDPSIRDRLLSGGIHVVARQSWRTLTVLIQKGVVEIVREGGLRNGKDWQTLRAAAKGASRALLIVDASDENSMYTTYLFGIPTLNDITHRESSRQVYDASIRVEEVR